MNRLEKAEPELMANGHQPQPAEELPPWWFDLAMRFALSAAMTSLLMSGETWLEWWFATVLLTAASALFVWAFGPVVLRRRKK